MKTEVKALLITVLIVALLVGLLVLMAKYDLVFYIVIGVFVVCVIGFPLFEMVYELLNWK